MYIHEAIAATTENQRFITRKAWLPVSSEKAIIRILPTNTPDGCVMISDYSSRGPSRGWQPRLDDLIAKDWIICRGNLYPKAQAE